MSKCETCIYHTEDHNCEKLIRDPRDEWIKGCPLYKQKDANTKLLTVDDAVEIALTYLKAHCGNYGVDECDRLLLEQCMEQKTYIYNAHNNPSLCLSETIESITPSSVCKAIQMDMLTEWCKNIQIDLQLLLKELEENNGRI